VLTNSASASLFIVDYSYDGVNAATACEQPVGATYYSTIEAARLVAATDLSVPHNMRICPGTYTENNTFNDAEFIGMNIEGTTGNPSDVIINGPNTTNDVMFLRQDKMSLRNVTVNGGRYGVRTLDSDATVLDNLIVNNTDLDGILIQSDDNSILNTVVERIGRRGILFSGFGDSLLIQSVKVVSTVLDCIQSNRGGVTLKDVNVEDCQRFGAYFNRIEGLSNLTIDNLTSNKTTFEGLFIRDYDASAAADNVIVTNVQISNAGRFGLYLFNTVSLNLNNIDIDTTTNNGVNLNNTVSSVFENININNAGVNGLHFNTTTANNKLRGITISNSNVTGFSNVGGDENTIEKLLVSNTLGTDGIAFSGEAQGNIILGYESSNNSDYGITIRNSQKNSFSEGIINSNRIGIRFVNNSQSNQFFDNYIHDNSDLGLTILSNNIIENNAFYSNCFINPVANVNNVETGSVNLFDNGSIGNFYGSTPAGSGYSEICADSDSNNICDVAYSIPGTTTDKDNFPSRDLTSINAACFSDAVAKPIISFQKVSNIQSDPVNGTTNPKAIPGAIVSYTLNVINSGIGGSDNNTVVIADTLPPNTKLVLGSPANPIVFADGSPSSGLGFTFSGLGSTTDDIDFSNDGGSTFIVPSADVDGIDITSPNINYIRINPKGILNGDSGSGPTEFKLNFEVKLD